MRLPAAPPMMSARPSRAISWWCARLAAYIPTPTSAAVAMAAISTVLNGNSVPLRMPNAAPLFSTCVKSMKPGMTVTLFCSGTTARTIAFVAWSITTMRIGSQSSRRRGGLPLPCRVVARTTSSSVSSIHRLREGVLAPLAQAGKCRIGRDRRHVPPAALAFDAGGAHDRHPRSGLDLRVDVGGRRTQLHLGDDEQHRQQLRVRLDQRE